MPKKRNLFSFIIFSIIKSFIFSLLFAVALSLILGYRYVLVNGWSSEPVIKYHSVIMIHKVDAKDLKVGDYVTFSYTGAGKITHRIKSIDLENDVIVCVANEVDKETGEINDGGEQTLKYANIQGKVVYSNYVVGELAFIIRGTINTIQKQPWILIALFGSFVLLLYVKEKCNTTPKFFER